jgi:hypothetical protein
VAGAAFSPSLGPAIGERIRPWLELVENVAGRFLTGTPFQRLVPARELAFAVLALYLGMETLSHLEGDGSRARALFAAARPAAAMFDALTQTGGDRP